MGLKISVQRIHWKTSYRVIPSQDPPINVFDRVANAEDFAALYEIEAMTNDRLRAEQGRLTLLPRLEWVFGPNASYLMAPFLHLNPNGSRFSDGSYGVYYASRALVTAVAETKYHRERFMRATLERPMALEMRVLTARVQALFHDIRDLKKAPQGVYAPDSYFASQKFTRRLKEENSWGVAFRSVRDLASKQRDSLAIFRPRALSHCQVLTHLIYRWDGKKIKDVFEERVKF